MLISQFDEDNLNEADMSKLLYDFRDDGQYGDCIVVLGSNKAVQYRLPKAIELYKGGRANKLLLSGGTVWGDKQFPEAMEMKRAALEQGVRESDVLVETESKSTKENALCSLLVLDRTFQLHTVKRLLIVTTAFHMRRAHLTFRTYMPEWISFSLCAGNDETTRSDNWWLNASGARRVQNESKTLIQYVKSGYLMDEDI